MKKQIKYGKMQKRNGSMKILYHESGRLLNRNQREKFRIVRPVKKNERKKRATVPQVEGIVPAGKNQKSVSRIQYL